MSFAFNVHNEQHPLTINGKQYLVDIRTTRFLGYTLITKVRCCEQVTSNDEMFSHVPARDFAMTLQSDHHGQMDNNTVNTHVSAVRQGLTDILNKAKDFYSYPA